MAEYNVTCPHCGITLTAQNEWIGMEAVCPVCKKILVITKTVSQVRQNHMKPLGSRQSAVNGKICPFCGNEINVKAVLCQFCGQSLTGNSFSCANPPERSGTSVWNAWKAFPAVRAIFIGIAALLLLAVCSGGFFVWNDNYLIKCWKIEKKVQTFYSDTEQYHSQSSVNYVLDNIGSFFAGFFFRYGEDTFHNPDRLLDKVLYRYGEHKEVREAALRNLNLWYSAKEQMAKNEGRYLDY